MPLRDQVQRLDKAVGKLSKLTGEGGSLSKLEDVVANIDDLAGIAGRINANVCKLLAPRVRQFLGANFSLSDIGSNPVHGKKPQGDLRRAVENALIEPDNAGIRISLQPGLARPLYVQAAALQYGAVRHASTTSAKRKKKQKSIYAASSESTGQKKFGGASYIKPHPFFYLTDAQRAELSDLYEKYWSDEIVRFMKSKGAG